MCDNHCREHCYNGDPQERVHYLERQLKEANERWRDSSSKAYWLEYEVKALRNKNHKAADEARFAYLLGKIDRQRKAIQAIQKKGWMPVLIIKEEEEDVAA